MPECKYPDSYRYKPIVMKNGEVNFAFSRKKDPENDIIITISFEDAVRFCRDFKQMVKENEQ